MRVSLSARNPKDESRQTPAVDVLVDTGSELSWLPADLLRAAGIEPRYRRLFHTATLDTVTRDVGYAILCVGDFQTTDEVVFAEPRDMQLLGARTVQGFGVDIDLANGRFVPRPRLVA